MKQTKIRANTDTTIRLTELELAYKKATEKSVSHDTMINMLIDRNYEVMKLVDGYRWDEVDYGALSEKLAELFGKFER